MPHAAALELIGRGADEILKREELEARLKLGRPLRVKLGRRAGIQQPCYSAVAVGRTG